MISEVFIIAFLVYATWYTFQEGEIFGFVQDWDRIPEWIRPPLFDCNVCMTPWWGSALYWLIFYNGSLLQWFVVVIAAMGVNGMVNRLAPDK